MGEILGRMFNVHEIQCNLSNGIKMSIDSSISDTDSMFGHHPYLVWKKGRAMIKTCGFTCPSECHKRNRKQKHERSRIKEARDPKSNAIKLCDSQSNPLTFIQLVVFRSELATFIHSTFVFFSSKHKRRRSDWWKKKNRIELVPCAKMTIRPAHKKHEKKEKRNTDNRFEAYDAHSEETNTS